MSNFTLGQQFDMLYFLGSQTNIAKTELEQFALRILDSSNAAQQVYDMIPKEPEVVPDYIAEMIRGAVVDDETTAELVDLAKDFVAGPGSYHVSWAALDTYSDETFKVCRSFGMTTQEQINIFEARE
jgi:hypothetical protein